MIWYSRIISISATNCRLGRQRRHRRDSEIMNVSTRPNVKHDLLVTTTFHDSQGLTCFLHGRFTHKRLLGLSVHLPIYTMHILERRRGPHKHQKVAFAEEERSRSLACHLPLRGAGSCALGLAGHAPLPWLALPLPAGERGQLQLPCSHSMWGCTRRPARAWLAGAAQVVGP